MCGIIRWSSSASAILIVLAASHSFAQSQQKSTFDISTLKYTGCAPGQSKTVTATVTVTDDKGRSASRSTKISVNCEPPYERFPDLIFAKNDARVNAAARAFSWIKSPPPRVRATTRSY
jgi:hypothetical protein